jgi:hypothetical protein
MLGWAPELFFEPMQCQKKRSRRGAAVMEGRSFEMGEGAATDANDVGEGGEGEVKGGGAGRPMIPLPSMDWEDRSGWATSEGLNSGVPCRGERETPQAKERVRMGWKGSWGVGISGVG